MLIIVDKYVPKWIETVSNIHSKWGSNFLSILGSIYKLAALNMQELLH